MTQPSKITVMSWAAAGLMLCALPASAQDEGSDAAPAHLGGHYKARSSDAAPPRRTGLRVILPRIGTRAESNRVDAAVPSVEGAVSIGGRGLSLGAVDKKASARSASGGGGGGGPISGGGGGGTSGGSSGTSPAPRPRVISLFRQPAVFSIASIAYAAPGPAVGGPRLIIWAMGSEAVSTPVTWSVSRYTGFAPAAPLFRRQIGPGDEPGTTALQAYGDEIGVFLAPEKAFRTGVIQPVVYEYNWDPETAPEPWQEPGAELSYSFELQVATASSAGGAVPYITAPVVLRDKTGGKSFWVNPAAFDLRGFGEERPWTDSCPTCTQMAMVSSKFASGTRYVKLGPGSSISQSSPWRGYRRFEYRVSADQVKAMASALGAAFSTDPKDYQLTHFNLNPEISFPEGAKGYLGTSFRKISISVIIEPEAPACEPKIGEFDSPNGCTATICYEDAACPAPGGYVAQGGGCYHKLTGKPQCSVAPIAPAPVPSCQPKIGEFDSPNGCTAFICYEDLTCSKPAGYESQGGGCYHKLTGKPRCGTAGGG